MYDLKPVIETSSLTSSAILFVVTAAVVLEASPSRRRLHKDYPEGSERYEREGTQGSHSKGRIECRWIDGKVGIYQIGSRLPGW